MLKYLIATIETLFPAAVLTGMLYGCAKQRFGEKEKRFLRIATAAGIVAAIVMAYLKNKTRLIRTDTWNVRIFGVSIVCFLVFLILDSEPFRKKNRSIWRTAAAFFCAVLVFLQWFYALPDVLANPYTIILGGDALFSTGFLYRMIGVVTGLALMIFTCAAVRFVAGRVRISYAAFLCKTAFLLISIQQFLKIVSILRARRILPRGTLFALTSFSANHADYYIYGLIVLTAVLPLLLLAVSMRISEPYENPAQLRKIRAGLRRRRRWSFAVMLCCFTVTLFVTGIKAYANRPVELSAIEDCIRDGDVLIIPFSQVEDGHLHRFAYTTQQGAAVRFIIIKKPGSSSYGIGLDACDICGETGYYERAGQVVCNRCDVVMNINTIGFKGGCNPKLIDYRIEDGQIVIPVETLDTEENNRLFGK
ncbi:MAG: DUF2318 domain-containing protein [Lachnospiraceae bacterium]|nr:DUF2318 domain-containing protein [Lachnospiraceae bacterium]